MKIKRNIYGKESVEVANALENLAKTCFHSADFDTAVLYFARQIEIRRKLKEMIKVAELFETIGLI